MKIVANFYIAYRCLEHSECIILKDLHSPIERWGLCLQNFFIYLMESIDHPQPVTKPELSTNEYSVANSINHMPPFNFLRLKSVAKQTAGNPSLTVTVRDQANCQICCVYYISIGSFQTRPQNSSRAHARACVLRAGISHLSRICFPNGE